MRSLGFLLGVAAALPAYAALGAQVLDHGSTIERDSAVAREEPGTHGGGGMSTGYTFFRMWMELLRIDEAHHILGMRLNFWVALIVFLSASTWFAWSQEWLGRRRPRVLDWRSPA